MSFFGSIVDKIVHYAGSVLEPGASPAEPTAPSSTVPSSTAQSSTAQSPASAGPSTVPPAASPETQAAPSTAAASLQSVDVGAVLAKLDEQKGGGLNYQTSIVDLLKLLDLDSSLAARKTLAEELNVHVAAGGTAEENEALHKAVVAKLAENGGKLPASMTA